MGLRCPCRSLSRWCAAWVCVAAYHLAAFVSILRIFAIFFPIVTDFGLFFFCHRSKEDQEGKRFEDSGQKRTKLLLAVLIPFLSTNFKNGQKVIRRNHKVAKVAKVDGEDAAGG